MNAPTASPYQTRAASTWPLHKAKARYRKSNRKAIARAAQQELARHDDKKL